MKIGELTLSTPVYNYYYGKGVIVNIGSKVVRVEFECKFLKNKFSLNFIADNNDSYYAQNNFRHISEIRLNPFTNQE